MVQQSYPEGVKIDRVYDPNTGEDFPASRVLINEEDVFQLRTKLLEMIHRETPLYLCPHCHKPVYLRSNITKTAHYFVHVPVENNCPYLEERGLSQEQIRAINYHGQKEGQAHRETKQYVYDSLKADPHFSAVKMEKVWVSDKGDGKRRRPDVSALYNGPNGQFSVAFEIQLSSTFLTEIVARKEFYLEQGALLVWVFQRFVKHNPKMTQIDIFYPNNLNAFVVNSKTLAASIEAQRLVMQCHWAEPVLGDALEVGKAFNSQLVHFDELELDRSSQRAFWFNYEKAVVEIEDKAEELRRIADEEEQTIKAEEGRKRRELDRELAVEAFIEYCCSNRWISFHDPEFLEFRSYCSSIEMPFPEDPSNIISLVKAISSVRTGRVIGSNHDNLIGVVNTLGNSYSELMIYFLAAINIMPVDIVSQQDLKGTWAKKKEGARVRAKKAQGAYVIADEEFRNLIFMLFPELEVPFEELRDKTNGWLRSIGLGANVHIRCAAERERLG